MQGVVVMSYSALPQTVPAEKSHARYRSQVNDMMLWAGVAYWEFEVAKGVFDISTDFAAFYGYKPEDLFPLDIERWKQLIHPDDWQHVLSMFEKVVAGHTDIIDVVYRARTASGEWRHLRSRGGVAEASLADKKAIRISGTLQDITDLKVSDMILQRRDRLLAAVNNAANILLATTIETFDQSAFEVLNILGMATEVDRVYVWKNELIDNELYCTQVYEWSPGVEPQQGNDLTVQCKYSEAIPTWEEKLSAGECVNNVVRNMPLAEQKQLSPQGIISILVAPVMFRGEFWGFIGFDDCQNERTWDGTEIGILKSAGMLIASAIQRQQAELDLIQQQHTLDWIIETSPVAIVTTIDGKVHRLNKRGKELFAVQKEMPSSEILSHILGEHQNRVNRDLIVEEILERGVFSRRGVQFPCVDGVVRDFMLTTVPFKPDSMRKLISWVVDITELKESERALIQAKDKAEIATRAKSEFLARMSHEIRTPMNAILGMIYLCLQTELNDKQWDYLTKTQSAAHSLLGIINDILDFSKIEAGRLDLESVPFSLKTTINEITDITRVSAEEKGLKFITKIDPSICDNLIGDPLRLRQILLNLTSNAVKFTTKGGIFITVHQGDSRFQTEPERICLVFEVKDTGIGLKPEQVETVFESFSQGDGSTTRKYGGTGLGLAIVKSLVELMGGQVNVTSIPGQGTTFSFTIVFTKSHAEPELSSAMLLQQRRVLIVDDNVHDLEILTSLMQASHMDVRSAHTGTEALEMLVEATNLKAPFELVMVDWRMPRMDGVEVVRRIRQNEKDIVPPHILMNSAYDRQECLRHVQGLNVCDVLVKPIQPERLKAVLKTVFREDLSRKTSEERADIRGTKILLAEDNKINQMVASELLKILGVEVTVANNGFEAVEAVKKNTFDLILMDIQMPEMDGLTAAQIIRNLGKPEVNKLPILAMTANAADTDYQKSLEVGMNDHLTKPIDPEKLRIALEKWIVR